MRQNSVSSRRLRQEFLVIARHYWQGRLWSASYSAGSIGGAPDVLWAYIQQQNARPEPRRGRQAAPSPTTLKDGAL